MSVVISGEATWHIISVAQHRHTVTGLTIAKHHFSRTGISSFLFPNGFPPREPVKFISVQDRGESLVLITYKAISRQTPQKLLFVMV